jgi:CDP-paratose 2-epimerase
MKPWNVLVTGSSGLVGSEAVEYFDRQGHPVTGIDNNMRREFFGPAGDTTWNLNRLKGATRNFSAIDLDLRDRERVFDLFGQRRFDLIIHCAAQPSHDRASEFPLVDFEVNAAATVYLLEATRQHCPEATFIFMSTNKVYGDAERKASARNLYPLRLR